MNSSNARSVWYCSIGGVDHGPVTAEQLKAWAVAGKLSENHVVWKEGNPSRVPARKVRGLFDSPKQSGSAVAAPGNSPAGSLDPAARDVFISCSSNDKPVADAICATLERDRIRCWIAPRDVLPGAHYGEAIIDGINVSRLMVIVLSTASNSSPQVLREVERAVSKGIPVIPFRIEDVVPSKSMEYFLSTPHWLDALTRPLEAHIEHLSNVVRTVLDPRRPPPLPRQEQARGTAPFPASRGSSFVVALAAARRFYAKLRQRLPPVPRRVLVTASALLITSVFLIAVLIHNWPRDLDRDYRKYRDAVLTGRGSIAFLKEAAPTRYADWIDRAKSGDSIAQLFIARCYQEGLVEKKDPAAAIPWLEKSAAQGNDFAIITLGQTYERGEGVSSNRAVAMRWYTQAAELGNAVSMAALGDIYGVGITKADPELAFSWYRKAADAGYTVAMRIVGDCFCNGTGVDKDPAQGDQWYQRALEAGDRYTAGMLLAKRLAPLFSQYLAKDASAATRAASLSSIRELQGEYRSLDIVGVASIFQTSEFNVATGDMGTLGDDDPLRRIHDEMVQQYIKQYGDAASSERIRFFTGFSTATGGVISRWFSAERYDDVAAFWEDNCKDIQLSELKDNEEKDTLIRQVNCVITSLMRTGKRKEAKELLQSALALCDWVLNERPWDWYSKDAYSGLCFDTAKTMVELDERDGVQPLLKRGWSVFMKQFGEEALLGRYTSLPLKGQVPAGASETDREFFERFSSAPSKKSRMKRFTIPADFNGQKYPFYVYILSGPRGYAELQDQIRWLKEVRGGEIPKEVRDSFRRLNKIAVDNNVDFMELCKEDATKADKSTEKPSDPSGSK